MEPDDVKDFCSVVGTSGEKVFLFGGDTEWKNSPDYFGPNNWLQIIDLSTPFRSHNNTAVTTVYPLDPKLTYIISRGTWENGKVMSADFEMIRIGADGNGTLQKVASKMRAWAPGIKRGYIFGGTSYLDSPKFTARQFDEVLIAFAWDTIMVMGDLNMRRFCAEQTAEHEGIQHLQYQAVEIVLLCGT
ncbi:hypothetical protein K440DRAFT_638864 [Wilcoxina mikolae CBS 423.85]|nr:hypothetical protein K440DRAFT_638864 [Wilcoxina mikolae CBS 423.85]